MFGSKHTLIVIQDLPSMPYNKKSCHWSSRGGEVHTPECNPIRILIRGITNGSRLLEALDLPKNQLHSSPEFALFANAVLVLEIKMAEMSV
jgi:hypothetical protein